MEAIIGGCGPSHITVGTTRICRRLIPLHRAPSTAVLAAARAWPLAGGAQAADQETEKGPATEGWPADTGPISATRIGATLEIYTDTYEQARRDALTRLQSLLGDAQKQSRTRAVATNLATDGPFAIFEPEVHQHMTVEDGEVMLPSAASDAVASLWACLPKW